MNVHGCANCGARVADYYLSCGLCDDCKWVTWLPDDYAKRERYVHSELWGHANATCTPPTGVEFLDHNFKTISELLPMCLRRPKSGTWISSNDTSQSRC